jgi:predicted GNAT superfamily acetyltransferase
MMPIEIAQDPVLDLLGNRLLLEIPFDFYTMLRETDVSDEKTRSIPLDWRLKTRRAFQTCFEQGYSVIDFQTVMWEERQRDFYLLAKSNP